MRPPLLEKIAIVRRQARRLAMVRGASLAAAGLLTVVVALAALDNALRSEDRGLRVLMSAAALSGFVWFFYRFGATAWRSTPAPTDLARRIQRRYPALDDRLLTAVEFLARGDDDPATGSPRLRQAVVARAEDESRGLDFSAILDRRPARRAAALLIAMGLVVGLLGAFDPSGAGIAVARLMNPFGATCWPAAIGPQWSNAIATDQKIAEKTDASEAPPPTPEQWQEDFARRQRQVLADLERALRLQQACRKQVETAVDRAGADWLDAALRNQREVERLLCGPAPSVARQIRDLLADAEKNRLAPDDVSRRPAALLREIQRLADKPLPAIHRELIAAIKWSQASPSVENAAGMRAASLEAAITDQDAVLAALSAMLGRMTPWEALQRISRQLQQMTRTEEEARRQTMALGRRTVAQTRVELASSEAAQLDALGAAQVELAASLEQLVRDLAQAKNALQTAGAAASGPLDATLDLARRRATAASMRAVGEHLAHNRIGQAVSGQTRILGDLQAMLDALAGGGEKTPATLSADAAATPRPDAEGAPVQGQTDADALSPGIPAAEPLATPEPADFNALARRHWGELPEQLRQPMLQAPAESIAPAYEAMIEAYFCALAAESNSGKSP